MISPPTPPSTPVHIYRETPVLLNASRDPPGIEVSLIVQIRRRGTVILVKALVHERLTPPTSYHNRSTYRLEEHTWPKFQQLSGAKDAFECLPKGLYYYMEMLSSELEASRRTLRWWNPEEKVDEIMLSRGEEPEQAALAFGAATSNRAIIAVDSKESVQVSRGGCMAGLFLMYEETRRILISGC